MSRLVFFMLLGAVCLGCGTEEPFTDDADTLVPRDRSCTPESCTPDSGSPDAGPFEEPTDEEDAQWLVEAERLQRGEPADLDLDGMPDFFMEKDATGGMKKWADLDGDGQMEWVLQRDGVGNEIQEFDTNQDGVVEESRSLTAGPPERLVILNDTDWDGRMDERDTITFGSAEKRVVVEADVDGDGVFSPVSDDTLPAYMAQAMQTGTCDPLRDFPPAGDMGGVSNRYNNIVIPIFDANNPGGYKTSHPGRCSRDRSIKLRKAITCARAKNLGCMKNTNKAMYISLSNVLSSASVFVACGNPCLSPVAVTADSGQAMNFNSAILDALDEPSTCAMVLHELIHVTGIGFGGNHDIGVDRTYSCARYCTGCTHAPSPAINPWPTANQECARCADSPDEKRQCGYKEKQEVVEPNIKYAWCHAGFDNSACEKYRGVSTYDCDDKRLPDEARALCCLSCPEGSDESRTDLKCGSESPQLADRCSEKTPYCN